MDDPAEDIPATDRPSVVGPPRPGRARLEGSVRARLVIVAEVLGKHNLELPTGEYEELVKAFLPHGS